MQSPKPPLHSTLPLQPGWALLMMLDPDTGSAGAVASGPAREVYRQLSEFRQHYGNNVWCTSLVECTDADGEPVSAGQELFDANGDLVNVIGFTEDGVEVSRPGEPSDVVEASSLRRIPISVHSEA